MIRPFLPPVARKPTRSAADLPAPAHRPFGTARVVEQKKLPPASQASWGVFTSTLPTI
jgi:hypothetical protein